MRWQVRGRSVPASGASESSWAGRGGRSGGGKAVLAEGGARATSRTSFPNHTSQRTVRAVAVTSFCSSGPPDTSPKGVGAEGGGGRLCRACSAVRRPRRGVRSARVRRVCLWPEVGGDAFHVSWGSCAKHPQNFPAHLGKEHFPVRTRRRLSGLGRARPGLGGAGAPTVGWTPPKEGLMCGAGS